MGGAGGGAIGPHPSRPCRPRSRLLPSARAPPCPFSAAVVKYNTHTKKRFLSNENKQLEPSAPALGEARGEAVYPTSSPKPRPRPFPSPPEFSPDPRHIPGAGAGGRPAAAVKSQVLDVRPPLPRWAQGRSDRGRASPGRVTTSEDSMPHLLVLREGG